MEYSGHTWRLPKRRTSLKSVTPVTMSLPENLEDIYLTDVSACNSFAGLLDDFDHCDEAHVPIFFQMNESRDAYSNVLNSCVATGKKR